MKVAQYFSAGRPSNLLLGKESEREPSREGTIEC
jgi:hypothetical protein